MVRNCCMFLEGHIKDVLTMPHLEKRPQFLLFDDLDL